MTSAMRKAVSMALFGAAVALAATAYGSDIGTVLANKPMPSFNLIHVLDLARLLSGGRGLALYDANGPDFRAANGVIPGARMLSSAESYDLRELPAAKGAKLVFYCANTH